MEPKDRQTPPDARAQHRAYVLEHVVDGGLTIDQAAAILKGVLLEEVERLRFSPIDELLDQRHDKFRAMGRDLVVMSDDRPGS